jgi:hypothetical protein
MLHAQRSEQTILKNFCQRSAFKGADPEAIAALAFGSADVPAQKAACR